MTRLFITHRWSFLISAIALVLLIVVSLYPTAWSSEPRLEEQAPAITPVSQLESDAFQDNLIQPATSDGNTSVEFIQSLQYNPPPRREAPPSSPDKPVSITTPSTTIQSQATPPAVISTPAVVVFPVMVHSAKDKAFSDMPVMMASAVANEMTAQALASGLNYVVLNPVYTYDDLREKALDGLYQSMVRDYLQAGAPNERDLSYLADQLSSRTQRVMWVAFVQSEFDTNNMTKPYGLQRAISTLVDVGPKNPNYLVTTTLQVFSTQAGAPLVYSKTATRPIEWNAFDNFTKSVFDDSDTSMNFKQVARHLATTLVKGMPPETYGVATSVQANLSPSITVPSTLTPADQETLKHIVE